LQPAFKDNLDKPVPACPTILDFAAAKDDGGGSSNIQNSQGIKLQLDHCHQPMNSFFCRLDGLSITQPTVSKN